MTHPPKTCAERVLDIISEVLALDKIDVVLTSSLQGDFDATSLELVTLALALEDEFGGSMPEDELTNLLTVQDVIDYIDQRLGAGNAVGARA